RAQRGHIREAPRDGDQKIAEARGSPGPDQLRGAVEAGKSHARSGAFRQGQHGVENVDNAFGLAGSDDCEIGGDARAQVLEQCFEIAAAEKQCPAFYAGGFSPPKLIESVIEDLEFHRFRRPIRFTPAQVLLSRNEAKIPRPARSWSE